MVEKARRQRDVAVGRELVGDGSDVVIDAEDLLDDDDATLGGTRRNSKVGADLAGR